LRLLIVVSVAKEVDAIGVVEGARIVAGGVGRVNAACAVTESILRDEPYDAVINAGIAGALPLAIERGGTPAFACEIGDIMIGSESVYAEEGLIAPDGFHDMESLGFPLAAFITGNRIAADPRLLALAMHAGFPAAPIATVATCSGTDAAARDVSWRTGGVAEAMEGAAAIHAARRLGVPAIEVRAISNTTGDRPRQHWDIAAALRALGPAVRSVAHALRAG
jgi:futalosine hydrolase